MTARPNILIASAAAKIPLVRAFQAALGRCGLVIAADSDPACAAGGAADAFICVKRTDDPGALEQMLDLCDSLKLGLIVPTRDGELPFFAEHRAKFEAAGTRVLVPSPESVHACQDKALFTRTLERYGYPAIPILDPAAPDLPFPLFARPRTGAGGKGARRIEGRPDLASLTEDDLLHPFIEAPEITIDLLMDLEGGRPVQAVARERVLVVGGESKVTRVIEAEDAVKLAMRLGGALGLVGHNTVQAFLHPDQGPLLIEINPRFGGASVLSIAAGLASPERILQMLAGDPAAFEARAIRVGETLYRTDHDLIVPGVAAPEDAGS